MSQPPPTGRSSEPTVACSVFTAGGVISTTMEATRWSFVSVS